MTFIHASPRTFAFAHFDTLVSSNNIGDVLWLATAPVGPLENRSTNIQRDPKSGIIVDRSKDCVLRAGDGNRTRVLSLGS
jgi:hypothetical protein